MIVIGLVNFGCESLIGYNKISIFDKFIYIYLYISRHIYFH